MSALTQAPGAAAEDLYRRYGAQRVEVGRVYTIRDPEVSAALARAGLRGQPSDRPDPRQTEEIVQAAATLASMLDDASAAKYLLDTVGPRYTTVGLGLRDARTVKQWAGGATPPRSPDMSARLRLLATVVNAVAAAFSPQVALAFLSGANPQLGDRSPLLVIAGVGLGDDNDRVAVMQALRAFLD